MRSIALRYNFYGGSSRVAAQAATVMQAKYPGLQIAGVENGFITAEQMPEFCDRLSQLQPRLIYVGLGVAWHCRINVEAAPRELLTKFGAIIF